MPPRRAQSLVRWIIFAAVVVAAGLTIILVLRMSRPSVVVSEMVEGPAVQAFYATGTLEPADREYQVNARASGIVYAPDQDGRYVDKGDRVRKGQVLAVIFDEALQRDKDKADADYAEKLALADPKSSPVLKEFDDQISAYSESLEIAKRAYHRYSEGIERGSANQVDYDRSVDRLKEVWSKVESLKWQRQQAELRVKRELAAAVSAKGIADYKAERMKLVSPIDGFVLNKPLQIGTNVNVNDVIMLVADTDPSNLVMRAQVDEEDVTKVTEPIKPRLRSVLRPFFLENFADLVKEEPQVVRMTFYAFEGRAFTGHVERIYRKADQDRRTFEVDVRIIDPSPRMQYGMTGELAFEIAHKDNTHIVPAQALQDGKFWIVRDGRLVRSDAKAGLRDVLWVEVAGGLQRGDKIVISPVGTMQDGQAVRIGQELDAKSAAEMNRPKKKELFRGGF